MHGHAMLRCKCEEQHPQVETVGSALIHQYSCHTSMNLRAMVCWLRISALCFLEFHTLGLFLELQSVFNLFPGSSSICILDISCRPFANLFVETEPWCLIQGVSRCWWAKARPQWLRHFWCCCWRTPTGRMSRAAEQLNKNVMRSRSGFFQNNWSKDDY